VIVYAQAGDDLVFAEAMNAPVEFHIGAGDDILIGDLGADSLYGSSRQDLIVAGRLIYLNLPAAVFSIQAEWTSPRSYADRVANLLGAGSGPRNNGDVFLIPGTSVQNDSSIDRLFGEDDQDWLVFDQQSDLASDLAGNETATEIERGLVQGAVSYPFRKLG
jgi:Ca2+-binding RTX toxin-like protein